MLQALNILENADLKSMGYNSPKYIHTIYQAMSLAFADRDFYYGDPYFAPEEPVKGLLSKDYAKTRYRADRLDAQRSHDQAGRSISVQGGTNPFAKLLASWTDRALPHDSPRAGAGPREAAACTEDADSPSRNHSMPGRRRSRRPMRKAGSYR